MTVLFDLDGTLIDSVRGDFLACSALFAEHGGELPAQRWAEEVCGRPDGYAELLAELPGAVDDRFARLRELWAEHMNPGVVVLLPAVLELLAALESAGVAMALVSASDREWVRRWLVHYDLARFFRATVSGDEVANRKPAPDLYLEAVRRSGADPGRCLAVEDSVTGVLAARAAGIAVAAVPTELTRGLDYSAADHVLDRIDGVGALLGLPA
ncbi:HAD family hydrolase [Saccharopolyspora erythraea]|uniref:HAD family hydrolase n=1 Tax=Saccharopolyspora erythraea TaxID=1836 RepID=UPI001BA5BC12|nr:HAD family phosphatase [Saccharopolyspora erythraea]